MSRRDMHTGPRTPRPVSRSRQGAAEASFSEGRAKVILGIFLILAALCLVRLVYLQVIVAGEYSEQAAQSRTVSIDIAPKRGTIYDRNGNVLATSIDALAVGISFACLGYNDVGQLAMPLFAIGVVSFLMSLLGNSLGVKCGPSLSKRLKPECGISGKRSLSPVRRKHHWKKGKPPCSRNIRSCLMK